MLQGDPQLDRELRSENRKAGRWRRRLFIVVVAVLVAIVAWGILAAVTTPTVAAQSPSTEMPPGFDGRVEMPDAGYAVTFPDDWAVEIVEEGSEPSILVLAHPEEFGPDVDLERLLVATAPNPQEREGFSLCTLVRYAPIDLTADEFLHEIFGQSDDIVIERLHDRLSRALVNPFLSSRIMVDTPEAIYVDHYAIGADNAVAVLMCYGVASHRDDWLSIAESIEFLPAEE